MYFLIIFLFSWPACFAAEKLTSKVTVRNLTFSPEDQSYKLHLTKDDEHHHFSLHKPDEPVLHENLRVYEAYEDDEGKTVFEPWTPDVETLKSVHNDLYIDPKGHSVFKLHKIQHGNHIVSGITRDFAVRHDGTSHFATTHVKPTSDTVPAPQSVAFNSSKDAQSEKTNSNAENIVELLLIADKELSDTFQQDRRRALDYFTTVMYDNMLRYRTLTSVKVAFRLSGLILNSNVGAQPYIEKGRNEKGEASFNEILNDVGLWLFEKQASLPKFDMATVAIATKLTWGGGLAHYRGVCEINTGEKKNYNTFVVSDVGDWSSPILLTHEAAHVLGSPHDDDDDKKKECNNVSGYIMSGGRSAKQWFFSPCSDKYIRECIQNERKSCLRRIDNENPTAVDFTNPKAPSMDAVCQRKLQNPKAYVAANDQKNCDQLKCRANVQNGVNIHTIDYIVDNMACTTDTMSGRCFRGRCRLAGSLIKNVDSGLCLVANNPFSSGATYELTPCSSSATPIERFVLENGKTGVTLASPFSQTTDGGRTQENSEKCAYAGSSDREIIRVWSDRCGDYTNPWHGWELVNVANNEFLIKHKVTGRCMKPNSPAQKGSWIGAVKSCNNDDRLMRWTIQA